MSDSQDRICGDGTTSVVILTAAIVEKAKELIDENVHASKIVRGIKKIKELAEKYFDKNKIRVFDFYSAVKTALSSKVVSTVIEKFVPLALKATEYRKLKVIKKLGDEIEESAVIDGYTLMVDVEECSLEYLNKSNVSKKCKVALLQYTLSAPKPNIDSKIEIESMIDQIIKEEREYVFNMIKKLKMSGVEIALVQKSILKESVSDLAAYFLKKLKIRHFMLEREEIEELSRVFEMKTSSCNNIICYDMDVMFFENLMVLNKDDKKSEYETDEEVSKSKEETKD